MFVGYLRSDFEESLQALQEENELFELELLKRTYENFPELCFAAYENDQIVAILSAYRFDKHIFINVLSYLKAHEEVITRLLKLLLTNSHTLNIYLLVPKFLEKFLKPFNFETHSEFTRYLHTGEAVAFNFSNSIAKQVNTDNYAQISKEIDLQVFSDNREVYIARDLQFSNSLKLSTLEGFMHSYVVNKRYIKISPWLMKSNSFLDAEKLLRGVLYYRGLKKLYAFAPKEVSHITELYESYKFNKDESYLLMYLGEKPALKLENLYAF